MAGYEEIDEIFGMKSTLYGLSGGDITKERAILDLTAYEVYTHIQIKTHYAKAERDYQELLNRK